MLINEIKYDLSKLENTSDNFLVSKSSYINDITCEDESSFNIPRDATIQIGDLKISGHELEVCIKMMLEKANIEKAEEFL